MSFLSRTKTILFFSLALPLSSCAQDLGWEVVDQMIASDFPDVAHIPTDSLSSLMGDSTRTQPVLFDVRQNKEYRVSHLRGARWIDPSTTDFSSLADLPKDTPIVLYCSVGYRSSEMAARLQAAGFSDVRNLEGSIFQWANEGRDIFRGESVVHEVHPYDAVWGVLLDDELRSE